MTYVEERQNFIYYKVLKRVLKIIAKNNTSIIDVGSFGVDMISDLPLENKVSVCINRPIQNNKCKGYKMDFFEYEPETLFDIVTCFQVIEHIEDAHNFTQKLFSTGKTILISLPYKWKEGTCKYHCQDPVDENKIYSWTNRDPDYTWLCQDQDHLYRIICLYCNNGQYKKELDKIPQIQRYPKKLNPKQIKLFWNALFRNNIL